MGLYPDQAPWTDIGSLQSDISSIKSALIGKADSHEIHSLARRLDSLEHTCREISSEVDGFKYRMQTMESQIAEGNE